MKTLQETKAVDTQTSLRETEKKRFGIAQFEQVLVYLLLIAFLLPMFGSEPEWAGDSFRAQKRASDERGGVSAVFNKCKWIALLAFTGYGMMRWRCHVRNPNTVSGGFAAFVLVATISSLIDPVSVQEAISRVISWWALYCLAFLFVVPSSVEVRISVWTNALMLVSSFTVLSSLLLIFLPMSFVQGRFCGVTDNANTLGSFAALTLAGAMSRLGAGREGGKWHWPVLAICAGVALCLSQSRASILGAASALLLLGFVRRQWTMLFICSIAGVLLVLFPLLLQMLAPDDGMSNRGYSSDSRAAVFDRQLTSWMRSPFLGNGLEVREDLEEGYGRAYGEGSYTDLLSAVGLLGLIPFMWGLAYGYRFLITSVLRRQIQAKGDDRVMPLMALMLLTVIVVNSIFEGILAGVGCPHTIFAWVILGAYRELHDSDRFLPRVRVVPSMAILSNTVLGD